LSLVEGKGVAIGPLKKPEAANEVFVLRQRAGSEDAVSLATQGPGKMT
jgi:hypothetical protein